MRQPCRQRQQPTRSSPRGRHRRRHLPPLLHLLLRHRRQRRLLPLQHPPQRLRPPRQPRQRQLRLPIHLVPTCLLLLRLRGRPPSSRLAMWVPGSASSAPPPAASCTRTSSCRWAHTAGWFGGLGTGGGWDCRALLPQVPPQVLLPPGCCVRCWAVRTLAAATQALCPCSCRYTSAGGHQVAAVGRHGAAVALPGQQGGRDADPGGWAVGWAH